MRNTAAKTGAGGADPALERARLLWRRYVRPLFVILLVIWTIRVTIVDWRDVPTASMQPNIRPGDRILVNLLAYDFKIPLTSRVVTRWSSPSRGDIVVFRLPGSMTTMVKRVIGLPGDRIAMRDGVVYLNDHPAAYRAVTVCVQPPWEADDGSPRTWQIRTESLGAHTHAVQADRDPSLRELMRRDFEPFTLPPDHYYLLGDNRDHSYDSRFLGAVHRDQILGKVYAILFSADTHAAGLSFRQDRWFRSVH